MPDFAFRFHSTTWTRVGRFDPLMGAIAILIKHSRALASGTAGAPKRYSGTTKRKDGDWFRRRIVVHEPGSKS